jgi:hypothetical protein
MGFVAQMAIPPRFGQMLKFGRFFLFQAVSYRIHYTHLIALHPETILDHSLPARKKGNHLIHLA